MSPLPFSHPSIHHLTSTTTWSRGEYLRSQPSRSTAIHSVVPVRGALVGTKRWRRIGREPAFVPPAPGRGNGPRTLSGNNILGASHPEPLHPVLRRATEATNPKVVPNRSQVSTWEGNGNGHWCQQNPTALNDLPVIKFTVFPGPSGFVLNTDTKWPHWPRGLRVGQARPK